jgi:glucose/arabinose dehydrogenase
LPGGGQPPAACGAVIHDTGGTNGYGRAPVVNSGQVSLPTDLAFIPGSTTAFVVIDQSGYINYFNGGCDRVNRIDLRDAAGGGIGVAYAAGTEQGLLNVEFHPDYATNRYVFFYHTSVASTVNSITRMTVSFTNSQLVLSDPQRIIDFRKADAAVASNHNGGGLMFAPDGTLLASVGDGGADNTSAQANNRLLGKVIRIQPSLALNTVGYSIPSGNMFSQSNPQCSNIALSGQDCPEILAKGLRNPFRMSRDGNVIYLGDVGSGVSGSEEINSFAYTTSTLNFGWPTCEGPVSSCGTIAAAAYRNPIVSYTRNGTTAGNFRNEDPMRTTSGSASIMIGDVYRGSRYTAPLNSGALMFGEFYDGFIRAVGVDANGAITDTDAAPGFHLVHATAISSMVQGPDGNLYLTAMGPSAVYRLVHP